MRFYEYESKALFERSGMPLGPRRVVSSAAEVDFELAGAPGPLVQLLGLVQEGRFGQPLLVREVEMRSQRVKRDEVRLKMKVVICHLHGLDDEVDA